jgi:hypothetical protein
MDKEEPEARVARFGRAEVAETFQDGYSAAMVKRCKSLGGYVRQLNANACDLCRWLHRYVRPATKGAGCRMSPKSRPVLVTKPAECTSYFAARSTTAEQLEALVPVQD